MQVKVNSIECHSIAWDTHRIDFTSNFLLITYETRGVREISAETEITVHFTGDEALGLMLMPHRGTPTMA